MIVRLKKQRKKTSTANNKLIVPIIAILLSIIGLFFIFEASSVSAFRELNDSFYFVKLQMGFLIAGISIMIFLAFFDYKRLYYVSFPILLASIVFLVLVLIPGVAEPVRGVRRWISLGPINIQPSEIAKLGAILYLSSWFLHKEKDRFLSFFLLLGVIIGLVMVQPDMGTAILLFGVFSFTYFLAGVDLHYLFFLIPFSAVGFLILVQTSAYRLRRFMAFLEPGSDPQGITYHLNQILISLSQGGLFGRGFAQSRQKYQFLPEAHTDSIFAIIGEEFGFIGAVLVIFLYTVLLYKIYRIAVSAKTRFGFLLAGSIFSLLTMQIIVNLAGMVNLLPLTGVPLPFISYGGSSLVVFFALIGIVISISRK